MKLENKARNQDYCPICGEDKEENSIVCWTCFKYTKDIEPLKFSKLSVEDWLKKYGKKWQVII